MKRWLAASLAFLIAAMGVTLACGKHTEKSSSAGSAPTEKSVQVPATSANGVDTGVIVATGKYLRLTATGSIQAAAGGPAIGPDGANQACGTGCPLPNDKLGALIGWIAGATKTERAPLGATAGATPFLIGASSALPAPGDGPLVLGVNLNNYSGASGGFTVAVSYYPDCYPCSPGNGCAAGFECVSGCCTAAVWTDPATGLMWQLSPPLTAPATLADAESYCANLDQAGYHDWRLPDIDAMRSLVRGCPATETGGACGVTDQCLGAGCSASVCNGCPIGSGPTKGLYCAPELGDCIGGWSSSTVTGSNGADWNLDFTTAAVINYGGINGGPTARCVR